LLRGRESREGSSLLSSSEKDQLGGKEEETKDRDKEKGEKVMEDSSPLLFLKLNFFVISSTPSLKHGFLL